MNNKSLCLVKFVIGLSFVVGASATALGEEFYKGKIIRFIVGTPPGGGYDTYTRAVARHIGTYIPGNPTPIVLKYDRSRDSDCCPLYLQQGQTGRPKCGGME